MGSIISLAARRTAVPSPSPAPALAGFSLEVMPRTAEKIADFRAILPPETRIYIAHIDGTPFDAMEATAARLVGEGFRVMPHIPARVVPSHAALADWLARYRALGIDEALVLGGGLSKPNGPFDSARAVLETGLFEAEGFTRLHIAGHPEGNRDIDPDGGDRIALEALRWKAAYAASTGVDMAIVTQFLFEAAPALDWADRLDAEGVTLPIHLGVAGPAKLQTLIKFAMACGVGPSLRVLTRRAADLTKLVVPFAPDAILADLAAGQAAGRGGRIERIHLFPLGGIAASARYATAGDAAKAQPGA